MLKFTVLAISLHLSSSCGKTNAVYIDDEPQIAVLHSDFIVPAYQEEQLDFMGINAVYGNCSMWQQKESVELSQRGGANTKIQARIAET